MNNMKKTITIFFVCMFILLILIGVGLNLKLLISQNNQQESLIAQSVSPNNKYKLEAYKTQPGATVDFSIKVYIINNGNKTMIYNAYHEYNVDIKWIDNTRVNINGKQLDLSKNEVYDWRKNE